MAYEIFGMIETLSNLNGVSGREETVREVIINMLPDNCEHEVDALGNLLVFKPGKLRGKNKILLSAHMDEVGFIVTFIDESGLLRFDSVGGIDSRVVIGKPVEIGDKRVYGVIGTKAVHHQEEKERGEALPLSKLYIDIGAKDKAEAESLVKPGDRAAFYLPLKPFGDGMLLGKALDDRAGCAVMLELLHTELACDCHFAFTVQEETGCAGGTVAGYSINPDISLVIETTTASDIAGVEPAKTVCKLGGGPVLSFMDKGTVYDQKLYELALETAKTHGIHCQSKLGVFGGNEARVIQTSRQGVRTLAVSMPCRYIHSPSSVLKKSDVTDTVRLLEALVGVVGI